MSKPVFQVQQIIDRKVFSGKVLYLTKWKGFSQSQATWQSVKLLKQYRGLIKKFNKKKKQIDQSYEQHKNSRKKIKDDSFTDDQQNKNQQKINVKMSKKDKFVFQQNQIKKISNKEENNGQKLNEISQQNNQNIKQNNDKQNISNNSDIFQLKQIILGYRGQKGVHYIIKNKKEQTKTVTSQELAKNCTQEMIKYLEHQLFYKNNEKIKPI